MGTPTPPWVQTSPPAGAGSYDCPLMWHFTWTEWNRYKRRWDGCAFCPGPADTLVAAIPWFRGGGHDIGNAMPACKPCRKEKGSRYITRWMKARGIYQDARNLTPAAFAAKYGMEDRRAAFLAQRRVRRAEKLAQLRAPLPMLDPGPEVDTAAIKVQMVVLRRRAAAAVPRGRNGL